MSFDSKYLIRWGIPGWVVMLTYLLTIAWIKRTVIFTKEFEFVETLGALISLGFIGIVFGYLMHQIYFSWNWLFSGQSLKINTKLLALITDSEMKQSIERVNVVEESNQDRTRTSEDNERNKCKLYAKKLRVWNEKSKRNHDIYFNLEYEWHKQLLLIEETKRNYINDRYRYLLSTVHALGALQVALIFSILGVIFIASYLKEWDLWLALFVVLLAVLVKVVYKGFSYYSNNLISFQAKFLNSLHQKEFSDNITGSSYDYYSRREERIES